MKMSAQQILANHFKNKPFFLKEAQDLGIERYELNKLVAHGEIVKLAHGAYALFNGDISLVQQFKNAITLIGKPSVICLLSALEFYDLTDFISKEIWVMVSANKRTRQKGIRLFRATRPNFKTGVTSTRDFAITSIERTLVDALTHERQVPISVAIESLRRAIQLNKTTLSKIVDTANELGVLHRIQSYIEALA